MQNWNAWGAPLHSTYYFDPLLGSDSNSGTAPASPWQTQAKAEQQTLTAGQSIMKKVDGEWILFRACAAAPSSSIVYGYYQTWPGTGSTMIPLSDINWGAYTHISHDHIEPTATGGLDGSANDITQANAAALISAAHANGVKVLLNIADIWNQNFAAAAVDHTATFINNIIRTVVDWGYDGVDIDWENGVTSARLHQFMGTLYPAIKAQNPNLWVNMAVGANGSELSFIPCLPFTDSMACMAYGLYLTGGKVTWPNAPLYDGDSWTYWGLRMQSLDLIINSYLKLGAPRTKLIAGLPFFAQVYGGGFDIGTDTHGPLRPRQPYTANYANGYYLGYNKAMIGYPTDSNVPSGGYYTPGRDHWDDLSRTPYLSIANADPTQNLYLTYDDPASITAKAQYAQAKSLAGLAIWEISLDWMPSRTIKQPLAQAIKDAIAPAHPTGTAPAAPTGLVASAVSTSSIKLNWATQADAFKYRIKRATVSGGPYTTLATQRQAGYTDGSVSSGVTYFYVVSGLGWGDVEGSNSSQLTIAATALSAPTNLVTSPADLTNAAWSLSGTGATRTATQIHSATTGQTDEQQVMAITASTDYIATVTLTATSSVTTWGTLDIAFANAAGFYAVDAGFTGGPLTPNVPTTFHVSFNSGTTYPKVILDISLPDTGVVVRVDHVSLVAAAGAYLPPVPTGLAITTPAASNTFNKYSAVLTWGWSIGASSYRIWRSVGDLGVNWVLLGTATETSFTDTNIGPEASWTYAVSAVHGSAESARSTGVTITTPATYAPPNALVSPSNLTNAAWAIAGAGASATDARTIALSTSGDTTITQVPVPVDAGTDYLASVTVTPSIGGWVILSVYDLTFGTKLATLGQSVEAGKSANWSLTFNTGSFTNLALAVELVTAAGAGNTAKIDGASVSKRLPEIPANLIASPDDLTNPVWSANAGTTITGPAKFVLGANGGIAQTNVPCKPNTDYLATCQAVREDTGFVSGAGGYLVFQIYHSPDYTPSYGLNVTALAPGDPTEVFIGFNSGSATNLIFAISVTDDAVGRTIDVAKLKLYENPYAHADTIAPPVIPAAAALASLTVSSTLTGGSSGIGQVFLNGAAGAGGAIVSLASQTAGVTVPASVSIAQGQSSASFTITTSAVTGTVNAQINATYSGVTKTATLAVVPGILVSALSLSASSVTAGTSVTGTVTLSQAAATGGQTVNLSSNLSYAAVPASMTVPAGSLTGTFTITTTSPSTNQTATITANIQGASSSSKTASLVVQSSTAIAAQIAGDQWVGSSATNAPNEAHPHGVPTNFDFYTSAVQSEGNVPPVTNGVSWNACIPWGTGYIDAAGDPSTNTRLQIRNLQLWFLSKSTGKWTMLVKTNNIDNEAYVENFAGDVNKPANVRTETAANGGGISFGSIGKGSYAGYNVHFYSTQRFSFNPADVGGWVSMFEARLIMDNPAGVDDRNIAKILANVGADYWQTLTSAMPAGQSYEPAIAGGKYKYATVNWRSVCMTTLSLAQLTQNPPQIDLSADAA